MTKFAVSGNAVVKVDDSIPTERTLSAFARAVDGLAFEKPPLPVTGFSDTAERVLADIERHPEFTIEFLWDDTATTGSWTVLKGIVGKIGTVTIFPDGTLGFSGECYCRNVSVPFRVGEELRFTAAFKWDNTVTLT